MWAGTSTVRLALCCLMAEGHLLVEDHPGVGKTTLAKALARSLGLTFGRVQFTADLLPADVTGAMVFDRDSGQISFRPGPVFTNILLADELNRASPKAQSALLESMEEHQVSADGISHPLPKPFMVIATQNPYDAAGTFPLPHSQRDRFLLRLSLGYPDRAAEDELLAGTLTRPAPDSLSGVGGAEFLHSFAGAVAAQPRGTRGAGLCPRPHRRDAIAPRPHRGRLAPGRVGGVARRRGRGGVHRPRLRHARRREARGRARPRAPAWWCIPPPSWPASRRRRRSRRSCRASSCPSAAPGRAGAGGPEPPPRQPEPGVLSTRGAVLGHRGAVRGHRRPRLRRRGVRVRRHRRSAS